MKKKFKHDLTEGNILKNLLLLALPITASNILQDSFNVVDMIFVGRLGSGAIAGMVGIWMGIALSNVVQGLIIWF